MVNYFAILVTNMKGMFIYDTFDEFIIKANDIAQAKLIATQVPYYVDTFDIVPISSSSANALLATNRTKQVLENVTKLNS